MVIAGLLWCDFEKKKKKSEGDLVLSFQVHAAHVEVMSFNLISRYFGKMQRMKLKMLIFRRQMLTKLFVKSDYVFSYFCILVLHSHIFKMPV